MNPTLDETDTLIFQNAAVNFNLVSAASVTYRVTWFQFDNLTSNSVPIGESAPSNVPKVQAPPISPSSASSFIRVDISALSAGYPSWSAPLRAYFCRTSAGWKLVGLER